MSSNPLPEISVVILCYRTGVFAKSFYKKVVEILSANNLDYEIVLVGNYKPNSGDATPQIVNELCSNNPRTTCVVKEKLNPKQAMGWDMNSGLSVARGESITVIDGDGQMDPQDIPLLFKTLNEKKLDICKARRISRGDGPYRKFISSTFNWIMKLLFPGITSDVNGKPKILTKDAYMKMNLESLDWFIDAEMMIKARRLGLTVGDIETDFYKNPERKSFVSFKANFEFLGNIVYWRIKEWGLM